MDSAEKIAIVTVVYNNYDVLKDFFKSLTSQKNKNFQVLISDLSRHRQPILSQDFPISVIQTENKGYAHGINTGVQRALQQGIHKFCVINNDTYFKSDFVSNIENSLNLHPRSIIGGKIYYAPGYEYHKDRYANRDEGHVLWYAGGTIDWLHAVTPHRGVDEVDKGQHDLFEETQFVNGALMCFDDAVYKTVGQWDESYFLYYEDSDFCVRAHKKGIRLYYDPSLVIWHKVSQSTEGSGSKLHQKFQEKNRLRFGLKYAPLRTKLHLLKNYILH